jgi:hypothetical protein
MKCKNARAMTDVWFILGALLCVFSAAAYEVAPMRGYFIAGALYSIGCFTTSAAYRVIAWLGHGDSEEQP